MNESIPPSSDDPRAEYARRLDTLKTAQALYESRHRNLGIAKLVLAVATLVVIGLALAAKLISVLWVLAPLFALVILAVIHERVLKQREHCSRTVAYYARALARMDNRWMGSGEKGERFQNASHPYSRDLDIFGEGSLFELLCIARTRVGEETLANWLLAPASPGQIRARQAAVADMRRRLDLREDLAVLAEEAQSLAPAEALAAWGEGEPVLASQVLRFACAIMAALWVVSLIIWMARGLGYPALLVTAINVSLNLAYRRRVRTVVSAVESSARDLALLAGVLARLESEQFAAPKLVELRAALDSQGWPPSLWIARLNRLLEYLDSRRNIIVGTIDLFMFWTLQCACAVEAWRSRTGPSAAGWPRWASLRLSPLSGVTPTSIPRMSSRSLSRLPRVLKPKALPIPCCRTLAPCGTTCALEKTCGYSSSAGQTWQEKAPSFGRWELMPYLRSVALRCVPGGYASRRSPWAHPSACSIRSRGGSHGSTLKSGA